VRTRQEISRSDAIRVIAHAREALCSPETIQDLLEDYHAASVYEALLHAYAGVGNGFLSQVYEAITGLTAQVVGAPDARFRCPCCNRHTLDEPGNVQDGPAYDICDHRNWEDDGTAYETKRSSVNHGSMAEYRERMRVDVNYYTRDKWRV
jgi:hypothetical protein